MNEVDLWVFRQIALGRTYTAIGREMGLRNSAVGMRVARAVRSLGAVNAVNAIYLLTKRGAL